MRFSSTSASDAAITTATTSARSSSGVSNSRRRRTAARTQIRLYLRSGDQEALRPENEDRDHGREHERIAIGTQVQRQRDLKRHRDRAEQVPAEDGARHAAEAADDRGDERREHGREAHRGLDDPGLRDQEHRRHRREKPTERKRRRDHGVRLDAHQPRGRGFSAAARICTPIAVRLRNSPRATTIVTVDPTASTSSHCTCTLPIEKVADVSRRAP